MKDIANIRDEDELLRLAELLALRTGNLLNTSSIATDLKMRRETAEKYISILEHLFLVYRLPAWHSNQAKDGEGLKRLAAQAGKSFKGGVLLYCGNNALPLKTENCIAAPMTWLWQNDFL